MANDTTQTSFIQQQVNISLGDSGPEEHDQSDEERQKRAAGDAGRRDKPENKSRLKEITEILIRNKINRGMSPQKLRTILEELGPTYIKLGQIMSLHSDILPQAYCDELMKLTSEVTPMPFETVIEVIEGSYRCSWQSVFAQIEEKPLGSASIAQVHRARLLTGEDVIVKVQRKGIYDTMARDIGLMKRAVKLIPPVANLRNVVDMGMILDEMWSVAQEEMDFLKEASNMEEFTANNEGIAYVGVPKLYREHTTSRVLVMEYIGGCPINDRKTLEAEGYDLGEVGRKLVNNYIKQVMDDGFFHADPHPGNVKVQDGKIVWIDMGMMGRLTEKDRLEMQKGIRGLALRDISMIENAVLSLGKMWGKPDRGQLYKDLRDLIDQYGSASMASIDVAEFFQALTEIMKNNKIGLPHGMSMLLRGLVQMQGVLIEICPDINMMEIASARTKESMLQNLDWKFELRRGAKRIYKAAYKTAEIPSLVEDVLEEYLKGQAQVRLNLDSTKDLSDLLHHLVRNLVMGLWVAALLIASSIICTTDMNPKFMGIPALGALGYVLGFIICLYMFIRHWITRRK